MPISQDARIREFLNYLTFQKRYSQNTIISYANDLSGFFSYVEAEYASLALADISPAVVRSWLASLKKQKTSSKTVNRKISTLKSFFKYSMKMNQVDLNPAAQVGSLKVSKRLPTFIEQKDTDTLFRAVDFPETWEGNTHRLLLMILYQTGIRLSELLHLKESSIDQGNGTIKVMGKGKKERIIPIQGALSGEIRQYLQARDRPAGSSFLLVNKKGEKLYPKYIYNTVKKYLGDVSTSEKKSPHVLRHSFATHLTNNGADINAIKELLGHASLASTQIYTHNSIEKLKKVHQLAHPKS